MTRCLYADCPNTEALKLQAVIKLEKRSHLQIHLKLVRTAKDVCHVSSQFLYKSSSCSASDIVSQPNKFSIFISFQKYSSLFQFQALSLPIIATEFCIKISSSLILEPNKIHPSCNTYCSSLIFLLHVASPGFSLLRIYICNYPFGSYLIHCFVSI